MTFFTYENFSTLEIKQEINKLWVFDIDNTLYPYCEVTSKLHKEKNIDLLTKFGVPANQCKDLMQSYLLQYGSIMKGITTNFELPDSYFQQLDNNAKNLYQYLNKDLELNSCLSQLDGHKICLTNGSLSNAKSALERLELTNEFYAVVGCDLRRNNYICKPQKIAFEIVNKVFNIDPSKVHFYDDREANVLMARECGWNTYLVDKLRGVKGLLRVESEKVSK